MSIHNPRQVPLFGQIRALTPPSKRLLMTHYMPWYEADPARNRWGWHWTMNHFPPERLTNGKREAASHYAPLIGLYDSNDPDTLECHVLLMKFAGIDGVIVDWYGIDDYLNYAAIHHNTQHLIRFVKKAGLRYAIMFEDQTVPKLLADQRIPGDDVVAHGRRLLQWDRIFAGITPTPQYFTESHRRPPAVGAFSWPQPAGGTQGALKEQEQFYRLAKEREDFIPAAFPRFNDIYEKAGVHKSWGRI